VQANEFPTRRRRIAAALAEKNVDASSSPGGQPALSDWLHGQQRCVASLARHRVARHRPRYQIQAAQETNCQVKVVRGSLYPALMKAAARRKFRRLGFEKDHLRYAVYDQLQAELALGASLEPVGGLVEAHRLVKSATEIELIRRSVETNSAAFAKVMRRAGEGARECDLAAELDYQMRRLGAQGPAFDTIVAVGPAPPAPRPAHRQRLAAQSVTIDRRGASQDGYASDMTRMAFLGRPGPKVKNLYGAVLEAQSAAISAVRPGVPRRAGRRSRAAGVARPELGPGVCPFDRPRFGLEIHEPPRIGRWIKPRWPLGW